MTDTERAALGIIQAERFKTLAELIHERRCIDNGMAILRTAAKVAGGPQSESDRVMTLERIVDDAMAELNRPAPKD